ncbi:site-specific integrase [Methylocystis suflitae]|uniref:hypothetical protein n=1 Tax=Methylocystis suflitae TaxID=2951405 RepID=UPI00210CFFB2|nr:hypothetical protein [Methylocystis suflitae]MCQ4189051.1 hypothetical protein [Methylocystis suflitae]
MYMGAFFLRLYKNITHAAMRRKTIVNAMALDGCGLASDVKGPLFRTIGRGTNKLTLAPLPQANAYAMIRRRTDAAEIKTNNHSLRATGITAYHKNGGTLEGREHSEPRLDAHDAAL